LPTDNLRSFEFFQLKSAFVVLKHATSKISHDFALQNYFEFVLDDQEIYE